jgi:hypothetical protein
MAYTSCGYSGLFIEFKVKKNKLTPEQTNFKKLVEEQRYCHVVCYNLDEAGTAVIKYFKGD